MIPKDGSLSTDPADAIQAPGPGVGISRIGLLVIALFFCATAIAPGVASAMNAEKLGLFTKALETAGQIDAYETYCKTPKAKKGKLSDRILAGAEKHGAAPEEVRALTTARNNAAAEKLESFKAETADCKNVDFLFEKYVLLQKLGEQTSAIIDAE